MVCCYPMELEGMEQKRSIQTWVTLMKQRVQIVMMLNSERVESPGGVRQPAYIEGPDHALVTLITGNRFSFKDQNCAE